MVAKTDQCKLMTVCDLWDLYSNCQGLVILRNLSSRVFKEWNGTKAYELLAETPTFITLYSIFKTD